MPIAPLIRFPQAYSSFVSACVTATAAGRPLLCRQVCQISIYQVSGRNCLSFPLRQKILPEMSPLREKTTKEREVPGTIERSIEELYYDDQERAAALVFGRRTRIDRRGFLGAGLAAMGVAVG